MEKILSKDDEVIISQCTPEGSGAIALIRISGVGAIKLVSCFAKLSSKLYLHEVKSHTVHHGFVINQNQKTIDEVMFIVMYAPKTFTGQDTVEITCHNNQFIISEIINLAISLGARIAHGGEFSKRSYLSGKIDLLQAEAINELIHANTQLALKKSLEQLEGSLSLWVKKIETELIKSLAWCEASFEFLDEEVEFGDKIKESIENIFIDVQNLKKSYSIQHQIKEGIRIAIIGSVNAGKSSLFNTLLNKKRSIVTNIAGTTRDSVEASLYKDGTFWTFVDTAGLRRTDDIIEKEGIERSFQEAELADIIILVFDGSRALGQDEFCIYDNIVKKYNKKIVLVKNKSDQSDPEFSIDFKNLDFKNLIPVSSFTKSNIDLLEDVLAQKVLEIFSSIESPFLLNKRHFSLLLELEIKLAKIIELFDQQIYYEILSCYLRDSIETISELTGKSVSESGLDMVFKEFCVGK